jgi:1,4-alpha-glucan branching enzyme
LELRGPAAAPLATGATAYFDYPPLASTGIVSPEIHPDRTVTFRIVAPKASVVEIAGEWMSANRAETTVEGSRMKRDDKGVWSTAIGPLEPNTDTYSFNVDGMNIADPVNPLVILRARTSASMVQIPGNQLWEFRDVPRGNAVDMKVLFFGVGKEDPRTTGATKLADSLTKVGIKHVFYLDQEGATGHVWPVWRKCLVEFAPLLFHSR